MPTLEIPETLVMPGSDTNGKALLSVIEAKILNTLRAESPLFSFRATATAANIGQIAEAGLARYRYANRLTHGKTFDPITGAVLQRPGQKETTVPLDQELSVKWMPDKRDMLRFKGGNPDVQATLLAEWATTVATNQLDNWEAIFFKGVYDYCVAFGQYLKLDLSSLTPETAVDAYYSINNKNIDLVNYIDETQLGTNKSDLFGALTLKGYAQLTKAFQRIVNMVAAETLASGKLYSNDILGVKIQENFFLGKAFSKDDETKLNIDESYDLTKMQGLFLHNQAFAMPISFMMNQLVIDNNTGFPKYMDLSMYSLPSGIRGWLSYIILADDPTSAEITAAQANNGVTFNKELFRNFVAPTVTLEKAKALNEQIMSENASKADPDFSKQIARLVEVLESKQKDNILTKEEADKIRETQELSNQKFLELQAQFKEALATIAELKKSNKE